jgi:antitoxin HigA-1
MAQQALIHPVHPGKVLQEEFLVPMGISQYRLAKEIGVSARRINEIVQGKRAISADTALRFSLFFGNSAAFWLGLQSDFELDCLSVEQKSRLEKIVHPWQEINKLHQGSTKS